MCGRGRSSTSAERSEAREDGVPRLVTCRVASPLVMALHGRDARRNHVPWSLRVCSCASPLPPASQGGSATRNEQRRLYSIAQASLRSAFDEVIRAKASESGGRGVIHARASKLRSRLRALVLVAVAAAAAPSGVIHARASESGGRGVIHARASKLRSRLRALKPPISAPEDSLRGAPMKASESGHLKRSFSSPPVASAPQKSRRRNHHAPKVSSTTSNAKLVPTTHHTGRFDISSSIAPRSLRSVTNCDRKNPR